MNLTSLRNADVGELKMAAEAWANYKGPCRKKKAGKNAALCFMHVAKNWFRFHGRLVLPSAPEPTDPLIKDFVESLNAQALSAQTIKGYSSRAQIFLSWLIRRQTALSSVTMHDVDCFIASRLALGWRPTTIATQCQALRSFLRYAAARNWCSAGLAVGIRSPAIPKYDGRAKGPEWKEVRRLIESIDGTKPASLRARAIVSLHAIYALRSSEVAGLRLSDFNWRDETFSLQRAKRGGFQQYPIQYEVGEAILRYLTKGRPRCGCRHAFVTLCPPYRPLKASSLWQITSHRMRDLEINSLRYGPHSLRHACATHLLEKGTSLKEIADFLGHRDTKSVGIYAKYDKRSLRDVAAFRLAELQ